MSDHASHDFKNTFFFFNLKWKQEWGLKFIQTSEEREVKCILMWLEKARWRRKAELRDQLRWDVLRLSTRGAREIMQKLRAVDTVLIPNTYIWYPMPLAVPGYSEPFLTSVALDRHMGYIYMSKQHSYRQNWINKSENNNNNKKRQHSRWSGDRWSINSSKIKNS